MSSTTPSNEVTPLFSNRSYDFLKWLFTIVLPAFGSLYFGLSQLWGIPYGAEITGTVSLFVVFGNATLLYSKKSYNASDSTYDGELSMVTSVEEGTVAPSLQINVPFDELQQKSTLSLKVTNTTV